MSKTTERVPVVPDGAWASIVAATDAGEKHRLARWAVTPVEVPGFEKPVPPFFFDLPWSEGNEGMIDSILADIVTAEDISTVADKRETRKLPDIVNQPVEVLGVMAATGDLEDARWGAYLVATISVEGGDPELFFVSAAQPTVTLWRLAMEGKLPAHGLFVEVAAAKKGQNAPLGFRYEEPL